MFRQNYGIDIELDLLNKKETIRKASATNQQALASVGFLDSLDFAAIFTMFLHPVLHKFLEEIGKYFMFPIAAAASLIQAILAWRQAYIDGGKTRSIVHAVVESLAAAAITTAVVGTLAASTVFALVTPIIFTATLAAKTVYHAGAASILLANQ